MKMTFRLEGFLLLYLRKWSGVVYSMMDYVKVATVHHVSSESKLRKGRSICKQQDRVLPSIRPQIIAK